jgi:predicted transcriptional regulator of viral defense system
MQAKVTKQSKALELVRQQGMVRPRDLREHGITREHLRRLTQRGLLVQTGRGLYLPANAPLTEHHSLAEAVHRVPSGVVCLLSALRFHNLTTQEPHEVWLALPLHAHQPKVDYPPLQTVRMSAPTLAAGIEIHIVENVPVRVFGVAKTVADCFKYRSKVGTEVALEALREGWRERRFTIDELWEFARLCRVAKLMRPYVEMVVS